MHFLFVCALWLELNHVINRYGVRKGTDMVAIDDMLANESLGKLR